MSDNTQLRAVANSSRLKILKWLKAPRANFPPQIDGCLVKDGVCALLIAKKLGVSQPTTSEHLRILTDARLVTSKRIKKWTFYKRNEEGIQQLRKYLDAQL
jgi:DNA-binding transcriptional ArsR family regulator